MLILNKNKTNHLFDIRCTYFVIRNTRDNELKLKTLENKKDIDEVHRIRILNILSFKCELYITDV